MADELSIIEGGLSDPAVVALLKAHLDLMRSQSPPESTHALDIDGLRAAGMSFWHVRLNGQPIACGALKDFGDGTGELKSMHTAAAARGRGVARSLLDHIEGAARQAGLSRLYLETGSPDGFRPARDLYTKAGYRTCGPFGSYVEDPYSVFMTKAL